MSRAAQMVLESDVTAGFVRQCIVVPHLGTITK